MMRFLTTALLAFLVLVSANPAGATEVAEILNNPEEWSGSSVEVEGELVGDFGRRSGTYWLQLNDDVYANAPLLESGELAGGNVGIALRVPASVFEGIAATEHPGGYRWRGPIIKVVGTFQYHDPERGGETYIDVSSLDLVEPGYSLPSDPSGPWGVIGLTLTLSAGLVLARDARRRRRQRRLEA